MKNILIVSSDRHLLVRLKYELSLKDYTIDTVEDPRAIKLLVQLLSPDLLIADFMLNDHNGGAISHQLKSDPETCGIPVILLSDYELETRYPSRFGCDLVIRKTPGLQPLLRRVDQLLAGEFVLEA